MKAFITLLSSKDYINAVLVLAKSLNYVNSQYSLVVAVSEDIYDSDLQKRLQLQRNIIIEKIDRISYSKKVINTWKDTEYQSVLNTACKYSLFKLTKYEKLCYIDADTLVVKNVDELLERPSGSIVYYKGIPDDIGFSALYVFKPSIYLYKYYLIINSQEDAVDGEIIGQSWFHVKESPAHQIPLKYCCGYQYLIHQSLDFQKDTKIVHFSGNPKPWLEPEKFTESNSFINLYKELLGKEDSSVKRSFIWIS